MEDPIDEPFRDEDGEISIKPIRVDSNFDFETNRYLDSPEDHQHQQQQPPEESHRLGRNLDDFLEAGFQATKGYATTIRTTRIDSRTMSSAPVSSMVHSTSYNSIGDDMETNESGDTTTTANDPLGETKTNTATNKSSSNNNSTYAHTHHSGVPLSAFRNQWKYWSLMLALGVANSSDATEILCISYILGDPTFQNTVLGDHGAGLLAAAVFLGMLLGGLLVGTLGDWIGRKPMLLLGLVLNAIAGMLFALAPSFSVMVVLRCLSGFGIGATIPPLFTLATELAPPSARGFCTTVIASFWMVGSIFVALVALWCFEGSSPSQETDSTDSIWAYLTTTWRVFALVCSIPSAMGATLVYLLIPESPRFLGLEGRSQEAVDVANSLVDKMSGGSGQAPIFPLTIEELEGTFPASALRDLEERQRQDHSQAGLLESGRTNDILRFLRTAGSDLVSSTSKLYENSNLRRTTFALQLVWFSLSFGSYGLMTWINIIFEKVHLENIYFNALLFAAANLPGNILAAIFLDRIKRSTSLIGSIACASVSLVLFAVNAMRMHPFGIVSSACLFQCFTIVSWNTIDTMTSELFPTLVRSTGWGVCAASARVGALIAQFVNEALVESPVRLLLVASGTLMVGALTPCLLPVGVGDMTGRPVHDDLQQGSGVSMSKGSGHRQLDGLIESNDSATNQQRGVGSVVRRCTRLQCSTNSDGG